VKRFTVAVLAVVLLTLGLGAAPASADWRPPSMGRASYSVTQGVHVVGGPFQMRGEAVLLADRLTRQGRHVVVLTMSPRQPIGPIGCYGVVRSTDPRLMGHGLIFGVRPPYRVARDLC
jgi:hypothetical protein